MRAKLTLTILLALAVACVVGMVTLSVDPGAASVPLRSSYFEGLSGLFTATLLAVLFFGSQR